MADPVGGEIPPATAATPATPATPAGPASVVVWPSAFAVGWTGNPAVDDPPEAARPPDWRGPPLLDVVPLGAALARRWTTDAHGAGVLVPLDGADRAALDEGGPLGPLFEARQPRLKKTAARALVEAGQPPVLAVVLVDFDRVPHEPWPDGPAGPAASRAVELATVLCPLASAYATRAGLRLVWSLPPGGLVPVAKANAWLRSWLAELSARGVGCRCADKHVDASGAPLPPGALGLHLDASSAEWTRGFRLPRVRRDGVDLDPAIDIAPPGTHLDWTPPGGLAALDAAPLALVTVATSANGGAGAGAFELPTLADLPPLTDTDWGILASTEGVSDLVPALRAGEPFAGPGDRDRAIVRGLGATCRALLRRVTPPSPPDDADEVERSTLDLADRTFAVWLASVEATVADGAGPELVAKAWRLTIDFAFRDAAEGAADLVAARERAGTALAVVTATATAKAVVDGEEVEPGAPGAAAGTVHLGPVELAQLGPVVVVVGQRFVVLDATPDQRHGGGYGPLVPAVALVAEIRDRAPGLAVLSARGIPHPAARIVAHHGTIATSTVAKYVTGPASARTTFDRTTRTLRRAVCPLRPVVAAEQADVAEWLAELAGGPAEAGPGGALDLLLDWLATVTILDRATAALYLRGKPDAGKTLFARGVASPWADAPVAFATAVGQFNAGLLDCPVVHLSEGVDKKAASGKEGFSAAFRALVGDRTHRTEAKYEPAGTLVGHPRVIIGANNDDALPIGEGHHTRDDLDAIARRVLYLRASPRAGAVLAAVPPLRLATWTDPGGPIAAHLAWLFATRASAALARSGSRFLVEGREGGWHRALLLRSGGNEAILAAIASGVAPVSGGPSAAAVSVEPADVKRGRSGRVWVNISRLHRAWKALVDEDGQRPPRATLARTVRDLSPSESSKVRRFGEGRTAPQLRAWDVPADLVLKVGEAHGIPQLDTLRARLAGADIGADSTALAPADGAGGVDGGAAMAQGSQGPRGGNK